MFNTGPGDEKGKNLPLLPGTRAIYSVKGCLFFSVGFRGYFGGFDASCVISDNEFASIWGDNIATPRKNFRLD